MPTNTPEFSTFLRRSLAAEFSAHKQSDFWLGMSAANVEVHHLRIPMVPKSGIANAVFWSVKRETPFDEKEVVLDFEVHGEVVEQKIRKIAIMAYTAPQREVGELKNLFADAGMPLKGISVIPFATQNLFRVGLLSTDGAVTACIFIGNNFSRIDIYSGNNLVMTRDVKAGMTSIVENFVDVFNERNKDRQQGPLNLEQGRGVILNLGDKAVAGGEEQDGLRQVTNFSNLREEDVFAMIIPALERLTRQIERTFKHYTTTDPDRRVEKIYLASSFHPGHPIFDYISAQLGIAVLLLNPFSRENDLSLPEGAAALSMTEKIAFAPALGLSFSDNNITPNLLFTYKDEEREGKIARINKTVLAVFILIVFICSGIFIYQNKSIDHKKALLAVSSAELESMGTPVSREEIMSMTAAVAREKQFLSSYAERNQYMLLLGELTAMTPANIRLLNLQIRSEKAASGTPGARENPGKNDAGEITMEGLIIGERRFFETTLASYVMKLEGSPFFHGTIIRNSKIEPWLKGETLHFTLGIKAALNANKAELNVHKMERDSNG
jgi:Tfp pilus assembly PilM family ATPase